MSTSVWSDFFKRVRFRGEPLAHPDSMVVSNGARFTVLTPRLLRLEWSETGEFEDRGTYAFPTRYAPVPRFVTRSEGRALTIDTGALTLRYRRDSGRFAAGNLSIWFERNGKRHTWTPGLPNPTNLRGTRRTLDLCAGDAALEEGLLSRAGWVLFDDSHSVLFDPLDGWVTSRPNHEVQDWYFFGYGHDYKGALADYVRFGGPVPLVPRYVLGAWWSRYWAYRDQDLKALVGEFEANDMPLDVLVVDMDWHTPHSWTGYTWNRELFPDPAAFLEWVHDKGLRVSLNLHPAEGVQAFEAVYPQFAEAMGVDAESGQAVPFRIADKRYAQNYFELLHHPLEDQGVDFWWVDWQQGETSEVQGLDPLLWLNHLHFTDSTRRGRRPMVYSRWGGLGNHRYQTGFSGDTWVGWAALQFQPHFTATASNVAYGWWGHDIGGHMGQPTEPELYARWVQFGALSPSLRLHATKDPLAERRPWKYPEPACCAARAAFHLRYQLVPYIYTMARVAHDTGVSLCRPMYYEHPDEDAAYAARYQYYFGDQMIAAPIVHPADPEIDMAVFDVWIPEGTWIDYQTKETFTGPSWVRLVGDLERVPMLVKAGGILPLAAPFEPPTPSHLASGTTGAIPDDRLVLSVFPGAHGQFRCYEDDGLTEAYKEGQYEWTEVTMRNDAPDAWVVHISPVEGCCDDLPRRRSYEIRLEGSRRPDRVIVDGSEISDWAHDPEMLRTTIRVPERDKGQPVTITALARDGISALGKARNQQVVLSDVRRLLGDEARLPGNLQLDGEGVALECTALLDTLLRGDVQGCNPRGLLYAIMRLGGPFVRFIEFTAPEEAGQRLGRVIVGAPAQGTEAFDLEVTWTLDLGKESEQHTVQIEGATQSQILDAPFAYDGRVRAGRWTAEVRLTWRGRRFTKTHHSQVLFPTVYAWHTLVYDQETELLDLAQVLDGRGKARQALDWIPHLQKAEGLININQPHGIQLSREHGQALEEGQSLAAYVTTTVLSPDERDVVFHFRSAGPAQIYLNGQRVEEVPVKQEEWLPGLLRKARRTAEMRLRKGENTLVIHSQPPEDKRPWWYLGGALTTLEGEAMTDLLFQ